MERTNEKRDIPGLMSMEGTGFICQQGVRIQSGEVTQIPQDNEEVKDRDGAHLISLQSRDCKRQTIPKTPMTKEKVLLSLYGLGFIYFSLC